MMESTGLNCRLPLPFTRNSSPGRCFNLDRYFSSPQRELSTSDLIHTNRIGHMRRRAPRSSQQLLSNKCNYRRRSASSLISKAKTDSLQLANKDNAVLLVGVTGGTGSSVLNGLLTSGVENSRLRVLTRNPESNVSRNFLAHGVQVIAGDLDDGNSVKEIVTGVGAIYCHATSKDAAKADPEGVVRAERLAKAAASAGVEHIVYNSSGGAGYGISQVEQKHNIEAIFKESGIPTTNLRATMFMEEFWKVYTRPQIIKGTFPFSMPGDKPLQLLAVKDMGLAAGIALKQPEKYGGVSLELAGDELTPLQMCEAYGNAQGSKVSHFSPPKFLFWFLHRSYIDLCANILSNLSYIHPQPLMVADETVGEMAAIVANTVAVAGLAQPGLIHDERVVCHFPH